MHERSRYEGAFWLTATLLLPMLYVASLGPAVWLYRRAEPRPRRIISATYTPLIYAATEGPEPVQASLHWYARSFGHQPVCRPFSRHLAELIGPARNDNLLDALGE